MDEIIKSSILLQVTNQILKFTIMKTLCKNLDLAIIFATVTLFVLIVTLLTLIS